MAFIMTTVSPPSRAASESSIETPGVSARDETAAATPTAALTAWRAWLAGLPIRNDAPILRRSRQFRHLSGRRGDSAGRPWMFPVSVSVDTAQVLRGPRDSRVNSICLWAVPI